MKELNAWFCHSKREFPWRQAPTPYKVWVSEVMLQQTRATVVVSYFEKWMELFPDLSALANAPIEKVMKAWEGLGYYSRARNLHKGAKEIIEKFGGVIPSTKEELETIAGLGPYTVGAILSFGFRKKAAAVDGNVLRVLTRYFCIEENVCRPIVRRKIEEKAFMLLDEKEPWVTTEALIELGATVCKPKPDCHACPLKLNCLGKQKAESLPIKNAAEKITTLKRTVVLIEWQGLVLVKKGEAGKVMADLYEFPYFEKVTQGSVAKMVQKHLGLSAQIKKKLASVTHSFTRYKAHLYPYQMRADAYKEVEGHEWVAFEKLATLPFSSGHRRVLHS